MKCHEERQLAAHLARAAGATETQSTIENNDKGFEDILKSAANECGERGGIDALVDNVLQGPPRWAYAALRYLPDGGSRRDELLTKAAGDPSSAFHTLRHVSDVGSHHDLLLQSAAKDPGWANMTLRTVSDLGSHRNLLLAAVEQPPPAEIGTGYNTYFVNETGADMWAMWNHGLQGSTGSLDGPLHYNKGQNVGYGRGGLCISEVRVFNHDPQVKLRRSNGPINRLAGNTTTSMDVSVGDSGSQRLRLDPLFLQRSSRGPKDNLECRANIRRQMEAKLG